VSFMRVWHQSVREYSANHLSACGVKISLHAMHVCSATNAAMHFDLKRNRSCGRDRNRLKNS
jgi:hypothetical protein